jgi:hypothetical protein
MPIDHQRRRHQRVHADRQIGRTCSPSARVGHDVCDRYRMAGAESALDLRPKGAQTMPFDHGDRGIYVIFAEIELLLRLVDHAVADATYAEMFT